MVTCISVAACAAVPGSVEDLSKDLSSKEPVDPSAKPVDPLLQNSSTRSGRIDKDEMSSSPMKMLSEAMAEGGAAKMVKTALKRRMGRFLFDLFGDDDGNGGNTGYTAPMPDFGNAGGDLLSRLNPWSDIDTDQVMRVRHVYVLQ